MCGICGKLDFRGAPVARSVLANMCAAMAHRGPDDEGLHVEPGVGLGQRRLSIIDLRRSGTPPLSNEDGSVWVVLNGEIYNYRELRAELAAKGHVFKTATDTEVIPHLYEEYGKACVKRMRGMFALALWDRKERQIFAARDRLGKKPFYYTRTPRSFVFGSTLAAVTSDADVSRSPDFEALDKYLTYKYVPTPLTAFRGVRKLPPAHTLVCSESGVIRTERYWSIPSPEGQRTDDAEAREELVAILREAVRMRMIADVPLGAFLSGGIDSGLVVALMAEHSSRPVRTFTIGFDDPAFDERRYARLVAERYGTDHEELVVEPQVAELLPLLMRQYGEPFADSSAVPTFHVSKLARQRVTVALSGDGGDENFGGYDHYEQQLRWSAADHFPAVAGKPVARLAAAALDRLPHQRHLARVSRAFYNLGHGLPERYELQMTCLKPQEKRALYTSGFRGQIASQKAEQANGGGWKVEPIAWMGRHDLEHYLPDDLMTKVDVASMASSLEVRCPLLDHRLVEFAAKLSGRLKRRNGAGKLILKAAARDFLPGPILERRKTGFAIPEARWLREDLSELLRASLLDDRARKRGLLNQSAVRTMLDQHNLGKRDWSGRLWALLCLELWFRECVDRAPVPTGCGAA